MIMQQAVGQASLHLINMLKFILIFFLFCNTAWAVDLTQDANCVGAWLFKEGSGESVADDSANSNSGTFLGAGEPAWAVDVPQIIHTIQ